MKGLDRVTEYRIPIITSTVSGYLIAAVEARKFTGGDASQKFLAVRRSLDGGLCLILIVCALSKLAAS